MKHVLLFLTSQPLYLPAATLLLPISISHTTQQFDVNTIIPSYDYGQYVYVSVSVSTPVYMWNVDKSGKGKRGNKKMIRR